MSRSTFRSRRWRGAMSILHTGCSRSGPWETGSRCSFAISVSSWSIGADVGFSACNPSSTRPRRSRFSSRDRSLANPSRPSFRSTSMTTAILWRFSLASGRRSVGRQDSLPEVLEVRGQLDRVDPKLLELRWMHHVDMPVRTRRRLGYEDRLCAVQVQFDDVSGFPQLVDPDQACLEARRFLPLFHADLLPGFRSELGVARHEATEPLI